MEALEAIKEVELAGKIKEKYCPKSEDKEDSKVVSTELIP